MDQAELHVYVGELGKGLLMAAQGGGTQGQKTLLTRRQGVRFQPAELLKPNDPLRKLFVREIAIERFIRYSLNLRPKERKRFADANAQAVEPRLTGERSIIGGVFSNTETRVLAEALHAHIDTLLEFKRSAQFLRACSDLVAKTRYLAVIRLQRLKVLLPRVFIAEKRRQVPSVNQRDFRTTRNSADGDFGFCVMSQRHLSSISSR